MNENGSEEGVAAAEIEETAPAAPRGPKQTPAPTEQSGATAAKPPVPTTTTARGATERDIHLTKPKGWTKTRWKNYVSGTTGAERRSRLCECTPRRLPLVERRGSGRGATTADDHSRATHLTRPAGDASARDVATTRGRRHHNEIANLYTTSSICPCRASHRRLPPLKWGCPDPWPGAREEGASVSV
jgi:hypothetical protein